MFGPQCPIPFEPIEEAAKFAWERAPDLCGPDCLAYHRTWALTRFLSMGGGAPAGAVFYEHGLSDVRTLDAPRVLISGGADTGLLALAVQSVREDAARCEFIYVDCCGTPVAQNAMMGERLGLNLTTIQTDILSLDIAPVDAVLSHSFISFLPRAKRQALISLWAEHLSPGGVALATTGVATRVGQPRKPKDPSRLEERARRLGEAARDWGMPPDDVSAFERLLRDDPMLQGLEGHWTEGELRAAFEATGLAVELVAFDAAKETTGTLNARAQKDRNLRVGIQARKLAAP